MNTSSRNAAKKASKNMARSSTHDPPSHLERPVPRGTAPKKPKTPAPPPALDTVYMSAADLELACSSYNKMSTEMWSSKSDQTNTGTNTRPRAESLVNTGAQQDSPNELLVDVVLADGKEELVNNHRVHRIAPARDCKLDAHTCVAIAMIMSEISADPVIMVNPARAAAEIGVTFLRWTARNKTTWPVLNHNGKVRHPPRVHYADSTPGRQEAHGFGIPASPKNTSKKYANFLDFSLVRDPLNTVFFGNISDLRVVEAYLATKNLVMHKVISFMFRNQVVFRCEVHTKRGGEDKTQFATTVAQFPLNVVEQKKVDSSLSPSQALPGLGPSPTPKTQDRAADTTQPHQASVNTRVEVLNNLCVPHPVCPDYNTILTQLPDSLASWDGVETRTIQGPLDQNYFQSLYNKVATYVGSWLWHSRDANVKTTQELTIELDRRAHLPSQTVHADMCSGLPRNVTNAILNSLTRLPEVTEKSIGDSSSNIARQFSVSVTAVMAAMSRLYPYVQERKESTVRLMKTGETRKWIKTAIIIACLTAIFLAGRGSKASWLFPLLLRKAIRLYFTRVAHSPAPSLFTGVVSVFASNPIVPYLVGLQVENLINHFAAGPILNTAMDLLVNGYSRPQLFHSLATHTALHFLNFNAPLGIGMHMLANWYAAQHYPPDEFAAMRNERFVVDSTPMLRGPYERGREIYEAVLDWLADTQLIRVLSSVENYLVFLGPAARIQASWVLPTYEAVYRRVMGVGSSEEVAISPTDFLANPSGRFGTTIQPVCNVRPLPPPRPGAKIILPCGDCSSRSPGYSLQGPALGHVAVYSFRGCMCNASNALLGRMAGIPALYKDHPEWLDVPFHTSDDPITNKFTEVADTMFKFITRCPKQSPAFMTRKRRRLTHEQWATKYPKHVAERMRERWLISNGEDMPVEFDCFVKSEKATFLCDDALNDPDSWWMDNGVLKCNHKDLPDARGISVPKEEVRYDLGPEADAYQSAMLNRFKGQILMAIKLSAEELSMWVEWVQAHFTWGIACTGDDIIALRSSNSRWTVTTLDMKRYDMHVRWCHQKFSYRVMRAWGFHHLATSLEKSSLVRRYVISANRSNGFARFAATQASGSSDTLASNSLYPITIGAYALMHNLDIVTTFKECGFLPTGIEVPLEDPSWDFLQKLPYPVGSTIKFAPKIGRFCARAFWSRTPSDGTLSYAKGVALGLQKDLAHVPIARAVVRRVLQLAGEAKPSYSIDDVKEEQYKSKAKEMVEATEATFLYVEARYGINRQDIVDIENSIAKWVPGKLLDEENFETWRRITRVDLS